MKNHKCCLLPPIHHHVYPIENNYRKQIENYVFTKLEEYSKIQSINFCYLTSLNHIRRRLKRHSKSFYQQLDINSITKEEFYHIIDEILDQIQLHLSQLQLIFQSQDNFENFLKKKYEFFSSNNIHNQWKQLQLQQAKKILLNNKNNNNNNDEEFLLIYENYILEKLTPEKLEDNKIPFRNQDKINLKKEYEKAEIIGQDLLTNMFNKYKQRQHPNIQLLQEIINHGMDQMIKRPKIDEFHQATLSTNILTKATFILKSKRSYLMSLQNLADDFMLLRFGCSLNDQDKTEDSISKRFINLIHMFLNTISLLMYLLKTNSSESYTLSSFAPFNSDLPNEYILSPMIYINEWTWLLNKWKLALETFPINLTNQGAFSRLVRTTIGVGISRLYGFAVNNEQDNLDKKFFQALQMGFYYGIAYSLVDGLQDNQNNQHEHINIDKWLEKMEDILCGNQFDSSLLPKLPITSLLLETFHSLIQLTSKNSITYQTFTDLALLLHSQRLDKKDLKKSDYNNIEIFLGPLLKSHFTYTATAFMGGAKILENFQRLWIMPFLGQLTDDCRDFKEDCYEKSITPVTYYIQHNDLLLNPFFVFLFICEDIYLESNRNKTTGAFLGRRIMRTLRALGNDLNEFLTIFTLKTYPDLYKYIFSLKKFFIHTSDPEKSIFRHINIFAKNYSINHRKLETFAYDYLPLIENHLLINTNNNNNNNSLIRSMNYSLKAGGKRLRPLLLFMVAQLCNININNIIPLARAIEYLHTSSLIFDDLPAQDNAPLRRGQPTLHMTIDGDYNDIPPSLTEGRAQLTAVNLIAYAIQSVTVDLSQEGFSYESINQITVELSQSMNELCHGQLLDLQAAKMKKKILTIDELDNIAYLKTGKAIEIVLVCPVILAKQEQLLDNLRKLGRLMGILFQMKDDLLDVQGETDKLGKLKNIDQQNQTITYINLLGIEQTQKRIIKIRKEAEIILKNIWPHAGTMQDVLKYICEREK